MVRNGQASRPLTLSRWLCLLLTLASPALRAEATHLRTDSRFAGTGQAPDPVSFVMAQADAGEAARRGADAAPAATPASPVSDNALMRMLFPGRDGRELQMAPIRWRGSVTLEQRMSRYPSGQRDETLEHGTFEVASYVGAPWLVQVRGNLGLVLQQHQEKGDESLRAGRSSDGSLSVTGGGSLAVFPASRFPFTATFESTDSRTSGEAVATDYVSRMLALRQTYRSATGDRIYSGSFEHSTLISDSFGRDRVATLSATMQRTFGTHLVEANGALSQNRRSQDGVGSDLARFSARHNYRHSENAAIDSFGSFTMTDLTGSSSAASTRFLQLNSFGSWRPDDESPWFVTGGARFSDAQIGSSGETARQLGVNAAARYAFSDQLHVVASGSVTQFEAGGGGDLLTNQSLAASYNPVPIALGPVNYSWSTSAAANNQTGGVEGGQHAAVAQANHQASAGGSLGRMFSLSGSINQGVSVQQESRDGLSQALTHSATVSLRMSPTAGSDGAVSLSVGDSRYFGAREDEFQIANLQVNGQLRLGAHSLITANLTVQGVRQSVAKGPKEQERQEPQTTVVRSGSVAWTHNRLFAVPRLRLLVSATFNDMQFESRLLGDATAPRDQYTRLYEGRLQYDIGRLDIRLGTRFATTDGRTDRQFYLRVSRHFGIF